MAGWLAGMARTGIVPGRLRGGGWPHGNLPDRAGRVSAAQQLFLTEEDLVPLLVLAVALTGRNPETVKELPAEHRVLEDRAVAVSIIKRRRGKALARQTVHWEIGPPSRQLHTPGGFYLLVHELTRRSRCFQRHDVAVVGLDRAQRRQRPHRAVRRPPDPRPGPQPVGGGRGADRRRAPTAASPRRWCCGWTG